MWSCLGERASNLQGQTHESGAIISNRGTLPLEMPRGVRQLIESKTRVVSPEHGHLRIIWGRNQAISNVDKGRHGRVLVQRAECGAKPAKGER